MLESNRRGMLVLYTILALVILTVIFSSAVTPPVGALMLLAYMVFVGLTAVSLQRFRMPVPDHRQPKVTNAARAAADHAPRGSTLLYQPYMLQDIGLIIDERRRDGVALRRVRYISMDDESLRPYVVLHYPYEQYPQQVLLRFELVDFAGTPQFVYEMDARLHPGENLILPDYRLPLKNNSKLKNHGTWDYTVSVDGHVMGVHRFNLLPSASERLKDVGTDGEISSRLAMQQEHDDERLPLSLEELLSRQSGS